MEEEAYCSFGFGGVEVPDGPVEGGPVEVDGVLKVNGEVGLLEEDVEEADVAVPCCPVEVRDGGLGGDGVRVKGGEEEGEEAAGGEDEVVDVLYLELLGDDDEDLGGEGVERWGGVVLGFGRALG